MSKSRSIQAWLIASIGVSLSAFCFSQSVNSRLTVTGGVTLELGALTTTGVTFKEVNFASLGADIQPFVIKVFSARNAISITMSSNTPSDSNGNPQLQSGSNFIPYTVSLIPCKPSGQPAATPIVLRTTTSSTINTPYSLASACSTLTGGTAGSLTFTRPALAVLPAAGTYLNTLTFTATEI
jgi:hypothetical protein